MPMPAGCRLRRSPSQTKAASEQRHARAERLREQLAEARLARLQEHMAKQQRRGASKVRLRDAGAVLICTNGTMECECLGCLVVLEANCSHFW